MRHHRCLDANSYPRDASLLPIRGQQTSRPNNITMYYNQTHDELHVDDLSRSLSEISQNSLILIVNMTATKTDYYCYYTVVNTLTMRYE